MNILNYINYNFVSNNGIGFIICLELFKSITSCMLLILYLLIIIFIFSKYLFKNIF